MQQRAKEWLSRYLPAEILALVVTVLSVLGCMWFGAGRVTIALVSTWTGTISYFGYILVRDIIIAQKEIHVQGRKYTLVSFLKNIRALVAEFGIAELLDSFLIRPALMYYLPVLVGNMIFGSILAKFAADITFYIPAIISYELTKKRLRKF